MKVYTYVPLGFDNPVICKSVDEVLVFVREEIECLSVGERLTGLVRKQEMAEEDFKNLPEHGGW